MRNSGYDVNEHFPEVGKLSKRNNGAVVQIKDYELSRYACYLIAQNGDSRKKSLKELEKQTVISNYRNNPWLYDNLSWQSIRIIR